jgi:hypothetical protein
VVPVAALIVRVGSLRFMVWFLKVLYMANKNQ